MASYETTSPQQKRLFGKIYKDASNKAFTVDNLKSGFRHSGIFPINVDRAVNNWQADHHLQFQKVMPTTPESKVNRRNENSLIPQNSQDVYQQADATTIPSNYKDCFFRKFVSNCGKSIEIKETLELLY